MSKLSTYWLIAVFCMTIVAKSFGMWVNSTDGGITDIVVYIEKDVPETDGFFENLKELMKDSSKFLLEATEQRLFFKTVTVQAPKTWHKIPQLEVTGEDLEGKSNILVTGDMSRTAPHTEKSDSCGNLGRKINLPGTFVSLLHKETKAKFGNPAYILVHEWAHLRFGVFDEGPSDPYNEGYESKLYDEWDCPRKIFQITKCSRSLKSTIVNCSPPSNKCHLPSNCKIVVGQHRGNPSNSSIMFLPYINGVSRFCTGEDWDHNRYAENEHNDLCNRVPTWDIVRRSDDFQRARNARRDPIAETTFRIVKQSGQYEGRVVIVIDVSYSMGAYDRLNIVKMAAIHVIRHIVPDGAEIGIVMFFETGKTLRNLTKVSSSTREALVKVLNEIQLAPATCIGCGLQEGLKALRYYKDTEMGGVLLVLSDGEENRAPYLRDVIPSVMKQQVTINSLAVGPKADIGLRDLALDTAGDSYYVSDFRGDRMAITEFAFTSSLTTQLVKEKKPVLILKDEIRVEKNTVIKFILDVNVGKNTSVRVTSDVPLGDIIFKDPESKVYTKFTRTQYSTTNLFFELPSSAKTGQWALELQPSPRNTTANVHVLVMSFQKNETSTVRVMCFKSKDRPYKLQAEVRRGHHLVIGAVIVATISSSTWNSTFKVLLYDNGRSGDAKKDDGTYSVLFPWAHEKSRLTIFARAENSSSVHLLSPGSSPNARRSSRMSSRILDDMNMDGGFTVTGHAEFYFSEAYDLKDFPPLPVDFLEVCDKQRLEDGSYSVNLTWSETGEYGDVGTAAYLEIRASLNPLQFMENFTTGVLVTEEHVLNGDLIPRNIWTQHFVRVYVPASGIAQQSSPVVYFSIRAWNSKNYSSNLSNVAVADFTIPQKPCHLPVPWPHDLTSRARPTASSSRKPTRNVTAGPGNDNGPPQREKSLVTVVRVGILFLVLLLFFLAAGVWYRYKVVTLEIVKVENADGRPLPDLEKAVGSSTQY